MRRIALGLFLLAFPFACRQGPWETREVGTPWAAPGRVATAKKRWVWNLGDIFNPAGTRTEYVWETGWLRSIDPNQIERSLCDYFETSGLQRTFRRTHATIHSYKTYEQLAANHRFGIVSIDPTVVVMIPYDYGVLKGRSLNDIAGRSDPNDRVDPRWGHREGAICLADDFFVGTDFPFIEPIQWFAPENANQPSALPFTDGRSELRTAKVRLEFGVEGDRFRSRRLE